MEDIIDAVKSRFLIVIFAFGTPDFLSITKRNIENSQIQVVQQY